MNVELLTGTEHIADMERVAALAALTCRGNADKEFVPAEVLGRIIKAGHESILEHINRALAYIQCDRRFTEQDLFVKEWDLLTEEDFAMLETAGYRGSSYVKLFSPQTIRSSVHYFMHLQFPDPLLAQTVRGAMDDPACGNIYRIKGSLPADDGTWRKINITKEKTEISAVLIVIGDELNREEIDRHFMGANTDPEYVSI